LVLLFRKSTIILFATSTIFSRFDPEHIGLFLNAINSATSLTTLLDNDMAYYLSENLKKN